MNYQKVTSCGLSNELLKTYREAGFPIGLAIAVVVLIFSHLCLRSDFFRVRNPKNKKTGKKV